MMTYNLVVEGFCGIAPSASLKVFVDGKLEYDFSVGIFREKDDEPLTQTAQRIVEWIKQGQIERLQAYQESLVP